METNNNKLFLAETSNGDKSPLQERKRIFLSDLNELLIFHWKPNSFNYSYIYFTKLQKLLKSQVKNEFSIKKLRYTGKYKKWYDNGKLLKKCEYVNGAIHGLYKQWHNNGQLNIECNCVNGVLHGPYKEWYSNGQLCRECEYIDGTLHGPYKLWYENGQPWMGCKYINGTPY